jgi:hypothetical protein
MSETVPDALNFAAYAERIGRSRPYVSKLVAEGRIHGAALVPNPKRAGDRLIVAAIADQQMAESADPARSRRGAAAEALGTDASYAKERTRLTAAQAEKAELELRARRSELLERAVVVETLAPQLRQLRDDILAVPRDHVLDPVQAAACEAALNETLARFSDRLARLAGEAESDDGASGRYRAAAPAGGGHQAGPAA